MEPRVCKLWNSEFYGEHLSKGGTHTDYVTEMPERMSKIDGSYRKSQCTGRVGKCWRKSKNVVKYRKCRNVFGNYGTCFVANYDRNRWV